MLNTRIIRIFGLAALLLLAVWISTGCEPSQTKAEKPSPDWSRGVEIGQYVVGSQGMDVNPETGLISLVWPFDVGEGVHFRFVKLDQRADEVVSEELDFPGQVRAPRLIQADQNRVHLFWSSRPSGGVWELWYVLLADNGQPMGDPMRISASGENVGFYQAAPDHRGGAVVIWGTGGQGPIYLNALDGTGVIGAAPSQVVAAGVSPSVRVDLAGSIHLAWQQGTQLYYARLPAANLSPVSGTPVADLVLGTGDTFTGPVLGLENGWAYVFWTISSQSGMQAGTARTEYVAFPDGQPAKARPTQIWIMPEEEQPLVPYQGGFELAQFVEPPTIASANTDFIQNPSTSSTPGQQLAVAMAANQLFRMDQHMQIVVGIFDNGEFLGYSFATKTESISDDPLIEVTPDGNIYLAWRERAGGRAVYFATTALPAIKALDRLGASDFINALLRGGIESFVSIALTPVIGFGWLLPGLLLMGVWKLFREDEKMSDPVSWIPFVVAMSIYELIKFVTLPTMVTYVPFSAWLAIPDGIETGLRVGVPVLITVIALLIANYVRTRYSSSAALFYVVFALSDAVLFLAVYGVNFLGVF